MIQLIALDIDGTLLNSEGTISNKTKQTLRQVARKGTHVVLCTGRPYCGVHSVLEELAIVQPDNYCVTFNGGLVTDLATGEHLIQHSLDYDDYCYFHSVAASSGLGMQAMTVDTIITSDKVTHPITTLESDINQMPIINQAINELDALTVFGNIMLLGDTTSLTDFVNKMPEKASTYSYSFSSPHFIEFMHPKATKANGIAELAVKLNLTRESILAIGNGDNDIPMLKYAGISVAMGNATQKVKSHADFVTTSNNHDGVAVAIEKFL